MLTLIGLAITSSYLMLVVRLAEDDEASDASEDVPEAT